MLARDLGAAVDWKAGNRAQLTSPPIFLLFSLTFCFYALKRLSV